MDFEDRITITTPEGLDLRLTLAGLGSRMAARLVDAAIQVLVVAALAFAFIVPFEVAGRPPGTFLGRAVFFVGFFLVLFGYHILFETFSSGRTPGKRWMGLRVVRAGGQPISFRESALRNIVRVVGAPTGAYVVGLVAILASRRNQRIGDMLAGTIVVRERSGGGEPSTWSVPLPDRDEDLATWDVTGVTDDDLATIRRFLVRRASLTPEARSRLAGELARRLRTSVAGAPERIDSERFLEGVVAAKARRM